MIYSRINRTLYILKNATSVIALISCLQETSVFASAAQLDVSTTTSALSREAYVHHGMSKVARVSSLDVEPDGYRQLYRRTPDPCVHAWVNGLDPSYLKGTIGVDVSSDAYLYNERGFQLRSPQFFNTKALYLLGGSPIASLHETSALIEDGDVELIKQP